MLSENCFIIYIFIFQLVVMIGIRKLLDFVFTQRELKILDDVMPEMTRRNAEDQRQLDSGEVSISFTKLHIYSQFVLFKLM